jgi:hypothetical protein
MQNLDSLQTCKIFFKFMLFFFFLFFFLFIHHSVIVVVVVVAEMIAIFGCSNSSFCHCCCCCCCCRDDSNIWLFEQMDHLHDMWVKSKARARYSKYLHAYKHHRYLAKRRVTRMRYLTKKFYRR